MAQQAAPPVLLTHHESVTSMDFGDGLTGSTLLPESREFVSTSNQNRMLRPPIGSTRDLYRREDGFYSEDDPVQYPQPFNPHYPYFAYIPKLPTDETSPYYNDRCMWNNYWREINYNFGSCRAELNWISTKILDSVSSLCQQVKRFLTSHPDWQNSLSEMDTTITLCLHQLTSVQLSLHNSVRGVAEIQRSWKTAVAIMDYVEVYKPKMSTISSSPQAVALEGTDAFQMGAFVWNDRDALMLFRANLPVYFIRGYNDFDFQIIRRIDPFLDLNITQKAASPSYPVIYTGQAGSDAKFAAIRVVSISCFDTPSPFENLHLEGAYQSSYLLGVGSIISPTSSLPSDLKPTSSGPIRTPSTAASSSKPYNRKDKKGKVKGKQPQPSHNLFDDLPPNNPFILCVISAWKDANRSIDQSHPGKCQMLPGHNLRLKTVLLDSALILGASDRQRQVTYLLQWAHIRKPLLKRSCLADGNELPMPLRPAVWRKVLSFPFHGLYTKSEATDKQAKDHQEGTIWLQKLFNKYAQGVSVTASIEADPNAKSMRGLVHKLCMLNFWFQMMVLDELANSTKPQPTPTCTEADLAIA
ncbi:hypothetical protein E1B28_000801 [Marasmius oreades]|uniref:Uncharacterized protein n=1 Tax=Marasmius oreades TaxID=181124 RepID=A0A9P7V212_9AGAR|nr:uncharacterized protein E1B28_000801 [Marasmius oreades]KAG7098901.1 hypothetical protein E1B28_000801 [Marasmius oreades]